jgi:uncharacterized protein
MQLTCPKCQGAMRQYERSGVNVDQCAECRGIFLDRGELERLMDAETAYHSAPAGVRERGHDGDRRYDRDDDDHRSYGSYGHGQPKRRKSFLSELFD